MSVLVLQLCQGLQRLLLLPLERLCFELKYLYRTEHLLRRNK